MAAMTVWSPAAAAAGAMPSTPAIRCTRTFCTFNWFDARSRGARSGLARRLAAAGVVKRDGPEERRPRGEHADATQLAVAPPGGGHREGEAALRQQRGGQGNVHRRDGVVDGKVVRKLVEREPSRRVRRRRLVGLKQRDLREGGGVPQHPHAGDSRAQ
eukprot:8473266-Pyramimonas_sp.AAC.1